MDKYFLKDLKKYGKFMATTINHGLFKYKIFGQNPHESMVEWSQKCLEILGISVKITGLEHIDYKNPQIILANHQSNIDIIIMAAAVPVEFYWIYKKELNSMPIVGSYLRESGHISINRHQRQNAIKSLKKAAKIIRRGKNIVAFPEGTRSGKRELKRFKKGVFHLALEAQVPIIPLTLDNSYKLMKKGEWKLADFDVNVTVHPPVQTAGKTKQELDTVISKVKSVINSVL
ncbi:MAG: lysophospholipid acyltransferase family protein [Deltaproteobacteria bacterium]|jgi:1-acyl-sn-glycerol-3-phosphate acyltransferase|nr:lysophospholipid acyltransferase family protein [Deltaproteobacteria bacterium]